MSGYPKTLPTFNKVAPPSNYVAGIGRGAMGFTTRSDIGPAAGAPPAPSFGQPPPGYVAGRGMSGFGAGGAAAAAMNPQFGQAPAGYVAGRGRAMGALARDQNEMSSKQKKEEEDRGDYSESNYDAFSGYGENLFARDAYDEDDAEADRVYDQVDEHMEGRHKRRREQQMLDDQKAKHNERPKIAEQFANLKRDLASVTAEQWDAIPEVGDHSLKLKQKKQKESFAPLPDHLLAGSVGVTSQLHTLDRQRAGMDSLASGMQTVAGLASEARGTTLSLKLDKMSDSVSGQTVVDPKGYLTDLNSIKVASEADVGDFKKARMLLSSVTSTNPKHGPGWIAAARVEEVAGKLVQARKIIGQGCEACPDSEDVWLEAARLHTTDNAKTILATAIRHLPTSVNIWLYAADLEDSVAKKKVVLRRALELVPNSVKLWKTAIELEDVADARILLARAVECVPHSVEMWLALAKLETHENARKVLNQAREAIPTEPATWVTAAKLEEAHGNGHLVMRIIEKMMASLGQFQVVIKRDAWLKEAEAAEAAGSPLTSAALVRCSLHLGVDDEDRLATWMDDADACLSKDPASLETARAIYSYALEIFPSKKTLWLAAATLEKDHGNAERLDTILKEAVKHCPHAEVLWLMAAKEKWLTGNVPAARSILMEAFAANSGSEQIWLAAAKLEWENNELMRARALLTKARDSASSERVWMKAVLLEREIGDSAQALTLLDNALDKYPTFAKFYLMAGQVCDEMLGDATKAREYYQRGLKLCPDCVPLWRSVARLEERMRGPNKARSMLELARLKLPKSEEIWLDSIRLERRAGNEKLAESLMAKALHDSPASGLLWAEEVMTCPKTSQRTRSLDALKRCDNDPWVITAVACLFEKERKIAKARKWFERSVALNPRLGDSWAHYYAFELRQVADASNMSVEGSTEAAAGAGSTSSSSTAEAEAVLDKCVRSEPNRGELWCSVAKRTENRRAGPAVVLRKVVAEKLLGQGTVTESK